MEEFAICDIHIRNINEKAMRLNIPKMNKFALCILTDDELAIMDIDLQTIIEAINNPHEFSLLLNRFIYTYEDLFDELP